MSLAAATAVIADGPERYVATIQPDWDILGNANGGYFLAIAARAASEAAGHLKPATVTAHFLAPGEPGHVTIETHVEKKGRRFTTVRATMSDTDRPLLSFLGSFTDQTATPDTVERIEAQPPAMPPPDDCVLVEPAGTFPPPFMGKVELRIHHEDATFAAGIPRFRGWFRLHDEEVIDSFGLLVAVDAFPPTVINAHLPIAWTPTLELTAHVRGRPQPGWLRCQFTTRFITGGYLEEDGEVWDGSGQLVVQSRQLALLPRS